VAGVLGAAGCGASGDPAAGPGGVGGPAGSRGETRRNYATDIALLLTFLWGRGRSWADAVERDLEDYEHWRRFAAGNPNRVGGSKWDRELAAFTSLYGWAVKNGHVTRNPCSTS
jgi:site-specific recombinase XerD